MTLINDPEGKSPFTSLPYLLFALIAARGYASGGTVSLSFGFGGLIMGVGLAIFLLFFLFRRNSKMRLIIKVVAAILFLFGLIIFVPFLKMFLWGIPPNQ